jgi:hypothetical protein
MALDDGDIALVLRELRMLWPRESWDEPDVVDGYMFMLTPLSDRTALFSALADLAQDGREHPPTASVLFARAAEYEQQRRHERLLREEEEWRGPDWMPTDQASRCCGEPLNLQQRDLYLVCSKCESVHVVEWTTDSKGRRRARITLTAEEHALFTVLPAPSPTVQLEEQARDGNMISAAILASGVMSGAPAAEGWKAIREVTGAERGRREAVWERVRRVERVRGQDLVDWSLYCGSHALSVEDCETEVLALERRAGLRS